MNDHRGPSIAAIMRARHEFGGAIRETPAWQWCGQRIAARAPRDATLWLKLELFQHTGSFKPRGAILTMRSFTAEQRQRGCVAVSAGNHGMAVAYAANVVGSTAKVVMPQTADAARIAACRDLGAQVVLVDNIAAAFAHAEQLVARDGLTLLHPFEHEQLVLGSATLGLEFLRQVGQLDALFVAIGGGGLAAGVACAVKRLQPRCRVFGVEPQGANTMHLSFAAGSPQRIDAVTTIADSLGAPFALPMTYGLCKALLDELVLVSDDELCAAMDLLFADAKLAVEPAGAATTAAMLQVGDRLQGKRIGMVVCGGNVSAPGFARCLARATDLRQTAR